MIIVTKNSGLKYRKVVEKDAVKLVSGSAEVVFAHTRTNVAKVNIIVNEDIDLRDTNQIIWALSTRLRPDQDVEFSEDGTILFDTTRMKEKLEVPSLPQDIIERITNKLRGGNR
jgi:UbiD family decarboxylase